MRFKSIFKKLFVLYGLLFFIVCSALGTTAYLLATRALTNNIEDSLCNVMKPLKNSKYNKKRSVAELPVTDLIIFSINMGLYQKTFI